MGASRARSSSKTARRRALPSKPDYRACGCTALRLDACAHVKKPIAGPARIGAQFVSLNFLSTLIQGVESSAPSAWQAPGRFPSCGPQTMAGGLSRAPARTRCRQTSRSAMPADSAGANENQCRATCKCRTCRELGSDRTRRPIWATALLRPRIHPTTYIHVSACQFQT
jgi:hypothetical protein